MTLKAQIESDVSAVLLSTDDFAETGTYLPKSGQSRSVVTVVDEDAQQIDEGTGMWLVETLHVFVSRDSTEGIDAPQLGDGFCREADHTPDGTPVPDKVYSFTGDKQDADEFAWTLQFVRKSPLERGGTRIGR